MNSHSLTRQDQKTLLRLSRKTLNYYFQARRLMPFSTDDPIFAQKSAVFVTLYLGDRLRGCVGQIKAEKPLFQAVQTASISAGFSDPRFSPLREAELEMLRIKIAVLSTLYPITLEEIIIGKHGLLLEAGEQRGLLLPEVASERSWDRSTFLEHLCIKANLTPGSWRDAKLSGFTTTVFEEPGTLT